MSLFLSVCLSLCLSDTSMSIDKSETHLPCVQQADQTADLCEYFQVWSLIIPWIPLILILGNEEMETLKKDNV